MILSEQHNYVTTAYIVAAIFAAKHYIEEMNIYDGV